MNNQQAWRGSVGVSQYRGIVSPAYFVMRLANCLKPDFANYLLRSRSVVSIFERCSRGVGTIQRNLIWDMLKVCRIAFPPLAEQEEIVKYLDAETGKIDRAIEVKRRQIELLRERRQIVIDEAVTGKVRVA
jgi:type I restriction enzyme S subunit